MIFCLLAVASMLEQAPPGAPWNLNEFQMLAVPVCAIIALRAIVQLIRRRVPRGVGFLAVMIWSAAALAIAFPYSTIVVARWAGIGRGADLVMYLALLAGLVVSSYFYQRIRQLEILTTDLARTAAIAGAKRGAAEEHRG